MNRIYTAMDYTIREYGRYYMKMSQERIATIEERATRVLESQKTYEMLQGKLASLRDAIAQHVPTPPLVEARDVTPSTTNGVATVASSEPGNE